MLNFSTIGLAAAALSAAVVAGPAGWFARDLAFQWHDRPAIIHEQVAICTSETLATAAKAKADEQLRQFRIGEAATEQFIIEQRARDDLAALENQRLEQERQAYELDEAKNGRACGLTQRDLDYVNGLYLKPAGEGAGG